MTTTRKTPAAKPAAPAAKAAPTKATPAKPVAARKATAVAKPAAVKPAAAPEAPKYDFKKPYKMLTGLDTPDFCDKVSAHLNAGYKLVGGATMTNVGGKVFVGQAVTKASNITKPKAKGKKKK